MARNSHEHFNIVSIDNIVIERVLKLLTDLRPHQGFFWEVIGGPATHRSHRTTVFRLNLTVNLQALDHAVAHVCTWDKLSKDKVVGENHCKYHVWPIAQLLPKAQDHYAPNQHELNKDLKYIQLHLYSSQVTEVQLLRQDVCKPYTQDYKSHAE